MTRRALEEGDLSLSAARVLAAAHDLDKEAFARSEAQLVEAARIHSTGGLQRVAGFWRRMGRTRGRAWTAMRSSRARRRLHASTTFLGMVRGDFDLDPEGGETLLTALRAVLDAEARSRGPEDGRSPAQRRADALVEICRQWLDLADRPAVAGERPHVTITVPADALPAGGGWGRASSTTLGPAPTETARRLACDASIMRVVLAGSSEPLDVGRRTSVVPPGMRRAVSDAGPAVPIPGLRPPTYVV